jgi:hypothetical protein
VIPYWILFTLFAVGALLEPDGSESRRRWSLSLQFALFIVALMIGLRFKVGADWNTYKAIFEYSRHIGAERMVTIFGDPAYALLTWSVCHAGGEIWQVNLVCGLIFGWGLQRFARTQINPWLATSVAIPYLVIVVAMGYSRQAVAIGILMAGLASVIRGATTARFACYVVAAALFHKTAVVMLPLVAFAQPRSRLTNLLIGLALSVLFYDLFLSESVNYFYRNYIKAEYSSQGAAIRIALNIIPAALFLLNWKRFEFPRVAVSARSCSVCWRSPPASASISPFTTRATRTARPEAVRLGGPTLMRRNWAS